MRLDYSCFLTLICLLLAGCNSGPTGARATSFQINAPEFAADPLFQPGMGAIADDQLAETESALSRASDWLLLGVKVARESEQDVWFVRLSSLPPHPSRDHSEAPRIREFAVPFGMGGVKTGAKFFSPVCRLRIETFDENGFLIRSSIRALPLIHSSTTLLDALSGTGSAFAADTYVERGEDVPQPNLPGVLTFVQLLGGAQALAPIRESIRDHVITKPSLLAIVLNGLRVTVEAKISERQVIRSPWPVDMAVLPREEAKFPVLLSGHRLFDCRVVVAPPNPPYNLTAGAVLIEAVHPENVANRLTVCVLATKPKPQGGEALQQLVRNK